MTGILVAYCLQRVYGVPFTDSQRDVNAGERFNVYGPVALVSKYYNII